MTEERIQEISEILAGDVEFTKKVIAMSPEEAVKALADKGFTVTAEELYAYGTVVNAELSLQKEELGEEDLDVVAGGVNLHTTCPGVNSTVVKVIMATIKSVGW